MSNAARKKVSIQNIDGLTSYVSDLISKESHNILGDEQKSMVASRLKKRLTDLGKITPDEYLVFLENNYESEFEHLVGLLTTHHTFFFREFTHFEYILENLVDIVENARSEGRDKIRFFSAACSRGQEVYSLATFLDKHLSVFPGIDFEVWGSDIDPESVKIGKNGVFPFAEVKSIPQVYLNGNWKKGTGEISNYAKVKDHIKEKCTFGVMNLLDTSSFIRGQKFDVIFCRNVFIYFNDDSIKKSVKSLKEHLYPNGLMITGLSESLKSFEFGQTTHAPSVYSFGPGRVDKSKAEEKQVTPATLSSKVERKSLIPSPIRVLAVDDSKSVLKLLGKIFSSDPAFELVGTAENGVLARDFLKDNEVDAMTLDIHMPEMDGVTYLKENFKPGHPHVIMISSASREDGRYAHEALKNGACDFVEKPALNNLKERAEEIKMKIKMSFLNQTMNQSSSLDTAFKKDFTISNCDKKARVYFSSFSDLFKLKKLLGDLKGDQPPVYLFFEGNGNFLDIIKEELGLSGKVKIFSDEDKKSLEGSIYLCDFSKDHENVKTEISSRKVATGLLGIASQKSVDWVSEFSSTQILIEDTEGINEDLKDVAEDIFPWTSFEHVGTEYLSED